MKKQIKTILSNVCLSILSIAIFASCGQIVEESDEGQAHQPYEVNVNGENNDNDGSSATPKPTSMEDEIPTWDDNEQWQNMNDFEFAQLLILRNFDELVLLSVQFHGQLNSIDLTEEEKEILTIMAAELFGGFDFTNPYTLAPTFVDT